MYINTTDLEYPVTEQEIRIRFANVSFPNTFVAPHPYALVTATMRPKYNDATHGVRELAPKLVDEKWTQSWEVYSLSKEQIEANEQQQWKLVRSKRNELLKECDWTQLPDISLTGDAKAQWKAFRQNLRDVTIQPDPFNIVWPVAPKT